MLGICRCCEAVPSGCLIALDIVIQYAFNQSSSRMLRVRRVLLLFVSNVLAHSDDPKYKRVKASNSRYQTAVGSKQGGPACMLALGFRLQRIAGQQVCPASPEALAVVPKHHTIACQHNHSLPTLFSFQRGSVQS